MAAATNGHSAGPFKTAIITGACSGIGLALTQHLLALPSTPSRPFRWRVVLADIRPEAFAAISPALDPNRTFFVPCDVSSWDDNAALFKATFDWTASSGSGSGTQRIDFLAANAGTDDKERVAAIFDLDAEPQKPNLKCLDVNLHSIFYQLKLFIHYARKTKLALSQAQDQAQAQATPTLPFNPKMTITASCVGQYPFSVAPHYAASKHAIVGLTRSVGPNLLKDENIAVNCVMPAFIATALAPKGLVDAWPKEHVTPMSTVVRAFVELMDEEGKLGEAGGVEVVTDGEEGVVKTGQCVECVQGSVFYRKHVDFANDSQAWMIGETREGGLWTGGTGYGGKKEREGMA